MHRARGLLWTLAVRPLLLPLVLVPTSCVVSSTPIFQEQEDCPPNLIALEALPAFNRVQEVAIGGQDFTSVTVPLRSCALTQVYETHLFIDGKISDFGTIPSTGEQRRLATIPVPDLTGYAAGCHRLEVYVSSRFLSTSDQRTPAKAGDIAAISWFFLLKPPGSTIDYSVAACNRGTSSP